MVVDVNGGLVAGPVVGEVGDGRGVRRCLERGRVDRQQRWRLDGRDVATVLGREGRALDRLVQRAMLAYLAAASAASAARREPTQGENVPALPGPITDRVHRAAERALR